MYTKTIKFIDFDGNEREETHLFNLTKAELTKMNLGVEGGLKDRLEYMMERQDAPTIMKTFENLIRASYGVKSPDGRRFMKSDEIFKDFEESGAYDEFYMNLCTDDEAGLAFINGILPADIRAEMDKIRKEKEAEEAEGAPALTVTTSN